MDIEKIKEEKSEENSETSLAFEIYKEQKMQNKRLFTALVIVLCMWLFTIGAFLLYISLPIDDVHVEQTAYGSSNNYTIGGDYNDSEAGNPPEAESGAQ